MPKTQNQNRIDGLNKALSEVRPTVQIANCVPIIRRKSQSRKMRWRNASKDLAEAKQKAMQIRLPNANGNWQKRRKS